MALKIIAMTISFYTLLKGNSNGRFWGDVGKNCEVEFFSNFTYEKILFRRKKYKNFKKLNDWKN